MCATAILIVIKHCYSNTYLEVLFNKQNIIYEVFNNCIFLIVWILRKKIFRGDEKTTFFCYFIIYYFTEFPVK